MSSQKGGSFLTQQTDPEDVFTPEDFSPEHQMIRDLAAQFIENEVLPQQESLERQEWATTIGLMRRCADLGLLGIEVPQEYGGEDLDKVSAMIVTQEFARVASFGVSYGGQAGIGALPLVYFGSTELKRQYLPALCKAEKLSAYALSEAASGSDALAAKTTARATADGRHWILNGEKMWITNAAFADIFVTFAQVDGNQFSCFIVERSCPGVSTGAEERKMGLKGSSTRTLVLDSALIPYENLVGQVGKGHHVAFNILNIGRAKLGAIAVGAGRAALEDSIRYAKQRVAFGKPIARFGAIQQKLGEMAIRTWVVESMVYRTAGLMDQALGLADKNDRSQMLAAIREYAVECSILKVYGSEALDFVVDEAVQIYGGYGYSSEYPVERYYRDARVNRIFEGTNEINRLLIAGMLLKRKAHEQAADSASERSSSFEAKLAALDQARKMFRFVAGLATKRFGDSITGEQEVLMHLSDIAMEVYAMDSALCRAGKNRSSQVEGWMVRTFVNDAVARIHSSATNVLAAIAEDDTLRGHLSEIHRLVEWTPINTVQARRHIAEFLLDFPL